VTDDPKSDPAQERANVVIERALELADAVAELRAYQSLLETLNSSPIWLAPPHVRALRVVRASALRSALGLVVAILSPPQKDRTNLGQVFALLEDQAVADNLTAPDPRRRKLPDRQKLNEARSHHAQLVASERYERVRHLRNSIAHLLGEVATVEYSDVFWLADEIDACVTELYQGIGLERDRDRWDATLFRETYLRGASMAGLGTG
jgi:hypothetical protein